MSTLTETRETAGRPVDELLGTVGAAMTRDVASIPIDMPLGSAVRILEVAGVSGGPVVEKGKIVGVVTLKDLFSVVPGAGERFATSGPFHRYEHLLEDVAVRENLTVADVMARNAVTVTADIPIRRAAKLMVRHGVNRLPVVDADRRPIGILSRNDIVAAVARIRGPKARAVTGHDEHPILEPD